jgi:hypothetical protein
MNVIKPSTPYGWSLFCDDIRIEANGKQIYIGVYHGAMFIEPSFPVRLPMFSVLIKYIEKIDESDQDVRFVILVPGQESPAFEALVKRSDIPPPTEEILSGKDDPGISFMVAAQFRDFVISEPGSIRVRVYRGDDEIRLGTLEVKLNPNIMIEPLKKDEAAN